MQKLGGAATRSAIAMQPPSAAIEQRQREVIGAHRGDLRVWVDEAARQLIMCIHARLGNSRQLGFPPSAAYRPCGCRRSVAAALPCLRGNDKRPRRPVRDVLASDYLLYSAVVRRMRRALCPPDGQRCDLRSLRQRAA